MKLDGAKLFFIIAMIAGIGASLWSYNKYTGVEVLAAEELTFMNDPLPSEQAIVPAVDINELCNIKTFAEYSVLDKRNLFSKFTPAKIEQPKLPAITEIVTKVKAKEPRPEPEPEPVVEEKKPQYFFRGTMMLEGEKAYIVEEPEIFKTHFLKEGVTKGDLILVEIARYGITIKDRTGTEYELPIKKE
ncbi:MAG: hypothetical protein JW938_05725 [Candidatus Omnitrophica bacterium]|nr:hypothetical protein [Candidatus Omnitrophota bacterium]